MHSMPVTLLTVQLGKKNTDLLFLSMSKFNLLGNGFVKRSDRLVECGVQMVARSKFNYCTWGNEGK